MEFSGGRIIPAMEFGFGGRITSVGEARTAAPAIATKFADSSNTGRFLIGYASRFNKPHNHKGRVEVFARGCFARNLVEGTPAISLLVMHKETELLGTTADRLELMQDEHGLAFRFRVPDTKLGREATRSVVARELCGMSVGYQVLADETKTIEGTEVRIIRDCRLSEISLCATGAVSQAYATVIDVKGAASFAEAVKGKQVKADGDWTVLMRSMDRLREVLERK